MQHPINSQHSTLLAYWDELDQLIERLRSQVSILQATEHPATATALIPYLQIMDEQLCRLSELHRLLQEDCKTLNTDPPPSKQH